MTDKLLDVENLTMKFGGLVAIDNLSFSAAKDQITSIIGPNGNFSSLPDVSKWILTVGMILGRLELFAILVLFLPSFWRN